MPGFGHEALSKRYAKYQSEGQFREDFLTLRAAVASGRLDNLLLAPTSVYTGRGPTSSGDPSKLDKLVFDTGTNRETGRREKTVKSYHGSSPEYWAALVVIAEEDTHPETGDSILWSVRRLRDVLGEATAATTIAQAIKEHLIQFDEFQIRNVGASF